MQLRTNGFYSPVPIGASFHNHAVLASYFLTPWGCAFLLAMDPIIVCSPGSKSPQLCIAGCDSKVANKTDYIHFRFLA